MPQSEVLPIVYAKPRRYRRFDLHFPVFLSFPVAGALRRLEASSQNVSLGGLLLKTDEEIPQGTPVRLTMELRSANGGRPVQLLGEGEVVRVEPLGAEAGYDLAIKCKRPITEIWDDFPAAV
jgi:HAMP domain-containing protein